MGEFDLVLESLQRSRSQQLTFAEAWPVAVAAALKRVRGVERKALFVALNGTVGAWHRAYVGCPRRGPTKPCRCWRRTLAIEMRRSLRRLPEEHQVTRSERNVIELRQALALGFRLGEQGRLIPPPGQGWRRVGSQWVKDVRRDRER